MKQEKLRKKFQQPIYRLISISVLAHHLGNCAKLATIEKKNLQHLRTTLNDVRPPQEACQNSRTLLYGLYRFCTTTSLEIRAKNDSHPLPWKMCLIFVPWSACLLLYPLPRFLCLLTWKHCLFFVVRIFCLGMCANKCCCTFAEISSLLPSFFSLLRKIYSSPSLLLPICSWKNEWPFPTFPPLI